MRLLNQCLQTNIKKCNKNTSKKGFLGIDDLMPKPLRVA